MGILLSCRESSNYTVTFLTLIIKIPFGGPKIKKLPTGGPRKSGSCDETFAGPCRGLSPMRKGGKMNGSSSA